MRVAFLSPIMDVNTGPYRNNVRNLATGVRQKVIGIDEQDAVTANTDLAERIVLALNGVPLDPRIEAHIWVGWHPLVADNIRDRYFDLQFAGLHQIAFNPAPMTEAFMLARLRQFAQEHGCERVWLVRPGDDLTTATAQALLGKFIPF